MNSEHKIFYEIAAKRFAASTLLYGVDSVVHVEDRDDIWFWQQLLSKYRMGRYKFLSATVNEKGNRNTGCTHCLKYKDFLSQKFFICIDSDFRYLLEEDGISAENGILQTYTYSWENHCAFADRLQQTFEEFTHVKIKFDFRVFLRRYAEIVYEAFLLMLYQERNGLMEFTREKFKFCISQQYRQGDEKDNGALFLQRMALVVESAINDIKTLYGFDFVEESKCYAAKGVQKENVYLYVRGHCLYNSLVSIGKKLCEGTGVDFEQNVLKNTLSYEQYDAISSIKTDIGILNSIRKRY